MWMYERVDGETADVDIIGPLRNISRSVAVRNKEIDSIFPITCPLAILEARLVDGSVKPIFRVIPGYFVEQGTVSRL